MVLLTSSQVQVALSTSIIFSFTFLLFLAGYVAQQRSVDSLHVALRPRAPSPRHKPPEPELPTPVSHISSRYGRPLGRIKDRLKLQHQLVAGDAPFDWSKLAYAQLVRDHAEVCNALILFSDLHRLKSSAQRLLLFPAHWFQERDGEVIDPFLETSKRLLKKASRRYRVTLVPISPNVEGKKEDDPEAYPMGLLAQLAYYERVLTLPPPGLVLDTVILDSILAYSDTSGIAAYPSLNNSQPSAIMIKPSSEVEKLLSQTPLAEISPEALLPNADDHNLFTTSYALRTANQDEFNATSFLASTAYMHFSDPDVPEPEYDIPYMRIVQMRPPGADQAFLWEKMYSTFKDRRYGVCGLDLEPWPPAPKADVLANVKEEIASVEPRVDL